MTIRVIGAGFGRTGTLSLKLALEQLGFAPCYHMMEVFGHPDHAAKWLAAAKSGTQDFAPMLGEYRAAVDWPIAYFWRGLAEVYADARVILTERGAQAWYASMSKTIIASMQRFDGRVPPGLDPARAAQMEMAHYIVADRTFGGKYDEANVLATYRRHNDEVKRAIPASRLLIFDSEGWEPLCKFLDVPVPAVPYPKTNSTAEFRARARLD